MRKDEEYFSMSLCQRMEEYINLDGPLHPYNPGLGQCYIWEGKMNKGGYGLIYASHVSGYKRYLLAHRAAKICNFTALHPKEISRHTCDNRACVNPAHIIAGTRHDNISDMLIQDRGNPTRGERHPRAKLSYDEIEKIRSDLRFNPEIAKDYGVSTCTIHAIKSAKNWKMTNPQKVAAREWFGEGNRLAKLTEEKVLYIRSSTLSDLELSRRFGVSEKTVYSARRRLTWRHVA